VQPAAATNPVVHFEILGLNGPARLSNPPARGRKFGQDICRNPIKCSN
jgi:hypothetical protein